MANHLADVATAAAFRHGSKPLAFAATPVIPFPVHAAARRSYAGLDVHATLPALLAMCGTFTPQEAGLIEEARRAFAKDAQRIHRLKRANEQGPFLRSLATRLAERSAVAAGMRDAPRSRRDQITDAAIDTRYRTVARAHAAELLKLRVAYRIPLHEWEDALARVNGVAVLLEVYAPGAERSLPVRIAPRCPPWAPRRYRADAGI